MPMTQETSEPLSNGHKAAKQDPAGKAERQAAADGKIYFSYAQIHAAVDNIVAPARAFNPDGTRSSSLPGLLGI